MTSLKTLGLAAAIGLSPACEKPAEQPEAPQQEVVSACERFRAAISAEVAIEKMPSHPAAWRLLSPSLAVEAQQDAHAETMAAAAALPKEDQGACLRRIIEESK